MMSFHIQDAYINAMNVKRLKGQKKKMKIDYGFNTSMNHLSLGVTITNYHNQYRAVIFDLIFFYVEIIFQDYDKEP